MAYRRSFRLHQLAMHHAGIADVHRVKLIWATKKAIRLETAALKVYEATCGEEPTLSILRNSLAALESELSGLHLLGQGEETA